MFTRFAILKDLFLLRLSDKRRDPPVGRMLLGTLLVYGCLCAYGISQL